MEHLWAPWRMEMIKLPKEESGCFFCRYLSQNKDEENRIVYRGKACFVILNRYPYNNGHIMVAPIAHIGDPEKLPKETLVELTEFTFQWKGILKKVLNADGFNIGMNIGKAAGAGVEDHLHMHIVPRWNGDTNFMPILSDYKVIPQSLNELYQLLHAEFERTRK